MDELMNALKDFVSEVPNPDQSPERCREAANSG